MWRSARPNCYSGNSLGRDAASRGVRSLDVLRRYGSSLRRSAWLRGELSPGEFLCGRRPSRHLGSLLLPRSLEHHWLVRCYERSPVSLASSQVHRRESKGLRSFLGYNAALLYVSLGPLRRVLDALHRSLNERLRLAALARLSR